MHIWRSFLYVALLSRVTNASRIEPLLRYDMSNGDCHRCTFDNRGILGEDFMTLRRNPNTTTCTPGFGVESKFRGAFGTMELTETTNALLASKQMGSLMAKLNDDNHAQFLTGGNGLTISLWIRPNFTQERICNDATLCTELDSRRVIFTVGWDSLQPESSSGSSVTFCDEAKIDLQLSITQMNLFEIFYRTNDQSFEPCQRMVVNASSIMMAGDEAQFTSRPMHVAISLGNYYQEVFVNGISLARKRERFDDKLKHWNPESLLRFFTSINSKYYQSLPWEGQLLQFSLHSGILNKHEVKAIMSEGLPPSIPVARSKVANIHEDAADKNGTLEQIEMSYTFLDHEIKDLLSSLDLSYQSASLVRHYITRFPTRGYLFNIEDNRMIEPSENLPVLVNADRLVFVPRNDEHSEFYGHAYASFDFCVTTNKIIMASQCISTTISVVVDPVNDPPTAIAPPLYVVHEGIQKEAPALLLTGSDVDKNDFIQNIQITSTPKMGFLFLSVSSFRKEDNLLHGTVLEGATAIIPGKELYVEYRFTDYNATVVHNSLVTDYFRFRVQDNVGTWSSEAEVKIQVLSSVFPTSLESTQVEVPLIGEGGVSYQQLSGVDLSGLNRTIGFLIKSLPSTAIVLDEEDSPLREDEIIRSSENSFDGDKTMAWTNFKYIGIQNTCNGRDIPIINDVLKYQVVALDSKEVTSVSSVKEAELSFVCAVETVSLQFITRDGSTNIFGFVAPADDVCSGYVFDFLEESKELCRNTTVVFGIEAGNTERLPEPVYVIVTSAPGGFLTMNRKSLLNAITLDDQPVMRRSIRFISPAERLTDALSEIHFQTDSTGEFAIEVTLQYGRCKHNETFLTNHKFSESSPDCYKTQETIKVNVERNPEEFALSRHPFPWPSLLVIILLGPVFYMKGKARQTIEELYAEWKEECTLEVPSEESASDIILAPPGSDTVAP